MPAGLPVRQRLSMAGQTTYGEMLLKISGTASAAALAASWARRRLACLASSGSPNVASIGLSAFGRQVRIASLIMIAALAAHCPAVAARSLHGPWRICSRKSPAHSVIASEEQHAWACGWAARGETIGVVAGSRC